ncbi:hypothetical protein JMUB6875_65220 [Nocardia sp. JMUB6875]
MIIIIGIIIMYGLDSMERPISDIMASMPIMATTMTTGISLLISGAGTGRGISGGAVSAISPPGARGGAIRGRRTKPSVAIRYFSGRL